MTTRQTSPATEGDGALTPPQPAAQSTNLRDETHQTRAAAERALPWALAVGFAAFLVPLGVYALTGFYTRYWADDYCFSQVLQDYSYWQAQVVFYQTTSSRFSVIPLIGITEFFGPGAIRWLPALNLAFLWGGFFSLLAALARWVRVQKPRLVAVLAATGLLFFLVLLAPNRLQVFYWRSGLFTYSFPLGLLAFNLAFVLRRWGQDGSPSWALAATGVLAFLAGGASETFGAMQTGLLGLAFLLALAALRGDARRHALALTGAALAGSVIALAVIFVSPSNQLRQVHFPPPPDLLTLVRMSLWHAFDFAVSSLRSQPLPNLVLLALGGAVGLLLPSSYDKRWRVWALVLIPLVGYILLVAVVSPSAYAQSASPEARALIVARFVTVLAVFFWGLFAAWVIRDLSGNASRRQAFTWLGILLLIGLSLYPLRAVRLDLPAVQEARAWAEAWDTRDASIRAAVLSGVRSVETVELDSRSGLMEIGPDPGNWVNTCAAGYYDLDSIRATP